MVNYDKYRRFLNLPSDDFYWVRHNILSENPETSFLFFNEGKLEERINLFKNHFLPGNPYRAIAYAIKSNPNPRILQILLQNGLTCFDCASVGEIKRAQNEDDGKATLLYNHPFKKYSEIKQAFDLGVRHFTVQSHNEIVKIFEVCPEDVPHQSLEIAVRLQTLNEKAKIYLSEKFGCLEEDGRKMIRYLNDSTDASPGISCNTGSQNTDPMSYRRAIKKLAKISREEGGVKTFNIGGGFPVNYFKDDRFDIRKYLNLVSDIIEDEVMSLLHENPKIIVEPGRSMNADCIDLYIPIISVHNAPQDSYIIINDSIYCSFSDRYLHDWQYNFKVHGEFSRSMAEEKKTYLILGTEFFTPGREHNFILGKTDLPVNIRDGDYVYLNSAGAYMEAQAATRTITPTYVYYNLVAEPFALKPTYTPE
jgi:ornithine decarboxylase